VLYLGVLMADNPERRRFIRMGGGLALAVGAKMLGISTAHAAVSVDCPIYMFHITSASPVEAVIRANARVGRIPVTIADLGAIIRGEAPVPEEPLFALTFDDGYLIQYQQPARILDRYEVPGTFFVMGTEWKGDGVNTYMKHEQIQDLHTRGHEIGSHTTDHANLLAVRARDTEAYWSELVDSKAQLEELLESEVTSFAYPNGAFDVNMARDVSTIYATAVSTRSGAIQVETENYFLRRTKVN